MAEDGAAVFRDLGAIAMFRGLEAFLPDEPARPVAQPTEIAARD